jgi:hypothetical protein
MRVCPASDRTARLVCSDEKDDPLAACEVCVIRWALETRLIAACATGLTPPPCPILWRSLCTDACALTYDCSSSPTGTLNRYPGQRRSQNNVAASCRRAGPQGRWAMPPGWPGHIFEKRYALLSTIQVFLLCAWFSGCTSPYGQPRSGACGQTCG